jgi:hypothetical protein
MIAINLRDEVQKVLSLEWRAFAEQHPRLAEVIDQTVLVEQAVASIADDPDFRKAMDDAAVAGIVAGTIPDLISRFVGDWLRRLF